MLRASVLVLLITFLFGGLSGSARAQDRDTTTLDRAESLRGEGAGTAMITGWPTSLNKLHREMGRDAPYLLPRIDSLALEYRYASSDSTSRWSFVLGWKPSHRVLYRGKILPREKGPSNIRMVNVELRADVLVNGAPVGEMIVGVDSMALDPLPSIYSFEVMVRHERVFLNISPEEARRALHRGVTLDNLVVERMGFVGDGPSTSRGGREPDLRERRRPEPSIYEPRTRIFIGWRVGPRPYYVEEKRGRRTVTPRGDAIGRGETAENGTGRVAGRDGRADADGDEEGGDSRSKRKDETEDDDEEDTSLRAPALGAVAAIGVLAYAGGTVGLYGRGDTPIGLAAGYTQPTWGFQLQAAVNGAVFRGDAGQELTTKALGFYDVFSSPVQPAVGAGVQIDPQPGSDVVPSVSLGLAGNFGKVILFGAIDILEGVPEVGLTVNFRHGRDATSNPSRESR